VPRRKTQEEAVADMIERGAEPLETYPGAHVRWRCRCMSCGEEYTPTYSSVMSGRGTCRGACMSEKIAASKRLDGKLAAARMIERGARPLVPYPGAAVAWHCICLTCGAEIWPRYDSVVNAGQGVCGAACKRRKIGEAHRLDGLDVAGLMKGNDLLPLVDYPGAGEPWMCRCRRCAEVVFPTYSNVRARGHQCWSCRARRFGDRLRLSEYEAVARMRENGLEPLTTYPGSVAEGAEKSALARFSDAVGDLGWSRQGLKYRRQSCCRWLVRRAGRG